MCDGRRPYFSGTKKPGSPAIPLVVRPCTCVLHVFGTGGIEQCARHANIPRFFVFQYSELPQMLPPHKHGRLFAPEPSLSAVLVEVSASSCQDFPRRYLACRSITQSPIALETGFVKLVLSFVMLRAQFCYGGNRGTQDQQGQRIRRMSSTVPL